MRMWGILPAALCRKHLLASHLETHMFLGAIRKGKSIDGYIRGGLVEVHNIIRSHDELVEEMLARGYNHKSPLEGTELLWHAGQIDPQRSMTDLCDRCPACFIRIHNTILLDVGCN